MPIITLEYTSNLPIDSEIKSFVLNMHHFLVKEINTDLRTCRSTIVKHGNFIIADGDKKNAYIMLTIRMLPGRSDELKKRVGTLLLQTIKEHFADCMTKFDVQTRVYLTETDTPHYYGLE
ncbi:MAG TPA: hypothetical protein VJK30_03215 [Coxiellaceae bacterium]|nr:MAG: hypothetical protein A3E81_03545 [Gammaproteobacteria bacterium RIFCSPHIGHO2_12_FULL_36_30]HLB56324.1 hypothetical protein [Coxiellaceae bacterium]